MPSSTSNSETRFLAIFAATLALLVGSWEGVLRLRSGATLDFDKPPLNDAAPGGERWVIFGNCLVMTGISPRILHAELGGERLITNIAAHEQSPIAFFQYLRRSGSYPDVVIANVSSWINGTNFEQEAELVIKQDPLGLRAAPGKAGDAAGAGADASSEPRRPEGAYRGGGELGHGALQQRIEADLSTWVNDHAQAIGHHYRLFDFGLFVVTLLTSFDLDRALYQLNMQPWYVVAGSESDGRGHLALSIRYRDDWPQGLETMAERSLFRVKLQRLLTDRYWQLLEENIRDMEAHGTRVFLVRMPEHPKIRAFNDGTYELPQRLAVLEQNTQARSLDLSRLGPDDGVRLFDAVHPDGEASSVISKQLADWLRTQLATSAPAP